MLEIFNQMSKVIVPEPYGTIIKVVCLLIIVTTLLLEFRRAYKQGYNDPIEWVKANKEQAFMWFGLLMLLFTILYVSSPRVEYINNITPMVNNLSFNFSIA